MTKSYKEFKVKDLREQLEQRGLPLTGTRNELIARLQASDAEQEASAVAVDAVEPAVDASEPAGEAPTTETAGVSNTAESANDIKPDHAEPAAGETVATADATTDAAPADAVAEAAEPEETKPELTVEGVIADLEKRVERNKRFGQETADLEAQIRRIKKFGISAYLAATQASNLPNKSKRNSNNRHGHKVRTKNTSSAVKN